MQEQGQLQNVLNILREEYSCPISRKVMKNPVTDCEGVSYQKEEIQKWLQNSNVSVVTGNILPSKALVPNYTLEDVINKIETHVPSLCIWIGVLRNQILQLKLENQLLKAQLQLRIQEPEQREIEVHEKKEQVKVIPEDKARDQRIQEQRIKALKKAKLHFSSLKVKQVYKEPSRRETLREQQKQKKRNQQRLEYQPQPSSEEQKVITNPKLSKRKLITKFKFQRYYDTTASNLIKKEKKNWIEHVQNINVKYALATSKYTRELTEQKETINKLKESVIMQDVQITQLNQIAEENQHPEKKFLDKLNQLTKEYSSTLLCKKQQDSSNSEKNQHLISILRREKQQLTKKVEELQWTLNKHLTHLNTEINRQYSHNTKPIIKKYEKQHTLIHSKIQQQKYKLQQQKSHFYQANLEFQKQKSQLKTRNQLLKAQIKEIQTRQDKKLNSLQIKVQQLEKELKDAQKQNKKQQKIKNQNLQLTEQNQMLVKRIQEVHKSQDRTKYKLSIQTKLYQEERDRLLEQLTMTHMSWMFIFSAYESAIENHMEFCINKQAQAIQTLNQYKNSENGNHIPLEIKAQIKQVQKIEKMDQQRVNPEKFSLKDSIKDRKVLVAETIFNIQKQHKKNSINQDEKRNVSEDKIQISDSNLLQGINSMVIETQKANYQRQKNIKQQIDLRMLSFDILLSSKLKKRDPIYVKALKQTKEIYQKISLLAKTILDQTPWNYWNIYKFYSVNHNNFEKSTDYGYQVNCVSLLKILVNDKQTDLLWQEVSCIKSKDTSLDDESWILLVKYSHLYQNVVEIDLENNRIQKITKQDLEKWKKLTKINLNKNPLSRKSKRQLDLFKNENPTVIISFSEHFF